MTGNNDLWESYYQRGAVNWRGSPYALPELPRGSTFLDIGCGTGSTLLRAAEMGYRSVGVDISPTALRTAARRLMARGLDADLREIDISRRSIGGKFDLIAVHYVLGAMTKNDRKRSSEVILESIAKRGILSFEDLAVGDIRESRGERIEERTIVKGNGIIQHFFEIGEVRDLFSGLSVVKLERNNWEHAGFERVRIAGILQMD